MINENSIPPLGTIALFGSVLCRPRASADQAELLNGPAINARHGSQSFAGIRRIRVHWGYTGRAGCTS